MTRFPPEPVEDLDRIDLEDLDDVITWSRCLGVSERRLREAVLAAGDQAPRVREYLDAR